MKRIFFLTKNSYIQKIIDNSKLNQNYFGAFDCKANKITQWSVVIIPSACSEYDCRYAYMFIFTDKSDFYKYAYDQSELAESIQTSKDLEIKKNMVDQEYINYQTTKFQKSLPFDNLVDQEYSKIKLSAKESFALCKKNGVKIPRFISQSEFINIAPFKINKDNGYLRLNDSNITQRDVAYTYANTHSITQRQIKMQEFIDFYIEYDQWHYLFPETRYNDTLVTTHSAQIGPLSTEDTPNVTNAYARAHCSFKFELDYSFVMNVH